MGFYRMLALIPLLPVLDFQLMASLVDNQESL